MHLDQLILTHLFTHTKSMRAREHARMQRARTTIHARIHAHLHNAHTHAHEDKQAHMHHSHLSIIQALLINYMKQTTLRGKWWRALSHER